MSYGSKFSSVYELKAKKSYFKSIIVSSPSPSVDLNEVYVVKNTLFVIDV